MQHLLPLLKRPDTWDVLIAHYLGVDHAGHTYGVNSRQMEDKLTQMDEHVSTVIGERWWTCRACMLALTQAKLPACMVGACRGSFQGTAPLGPIGRVAEDAHAQTTAINVSNQQHGKTNSMVLACRACAAVTAQSPLLQKQALVGRMRTLCL